MNRIIAAYIIASLFGQGWLLYEYNKARVCNKVFVKYFSLYDINVDLDKLYEDGKTWVDDPKYDSFPNRRHR